MAALNSTAELLQHSTSLRGLITSSALAIMRVIPALITGSAVAVNAVSIADINGPKFQSSYSASSVSNVTGLVTAVNSRGFWVRSITPDNDDRTSESIFVFSSAQSSLRKAGEVITFGAHVSEYRSNSDYLYLTELTNPASITVSASNQSVVPVVLGTYTSHIIGDKNLSPPTHQYTSLDKGDVFGIPGGQKLLTDQNPALEPRKYGLDFWESLSGELVTVPAPTVLNRPNRYGETWIIGKWNATGLNKRGGITVGDKDGNPETVIIGSPLDGSRNPNTFKLGDKLEDITGVVYYQFGLYYILPQTALRLKTAVSPDLPPPTDITGTGTCEALLVGDYNVENLAYNSSHLPFVASHIATYLKSPSLMFLQEIQDNDGPADDGEVDANKTLSTLTTAITKAGGVSYDFADVNPLNDQDGGQPGGNIRSAYLYNSKHLRLHNPNSGNSTQENAVLPGPTLKYNPGLLGTTSSAFDDTRKPLVAEWTTVAGGHHLFTVALHLTSKGGSTSLAGNPRPPVNYNVDKRGAQLRLVADFVSELLQQDPQAAVVVAGDFNEYEYVQAVREFVQVSGLVNLNDAAGVPVEERYTYLFQQNCQEIDQVFVSPSIAGKTPVVDHVHINTWASFAQEVSDHDPSVMRLDVCH